MKNIKLYINNQVVDLPEGISIPISYTLEDINNPTIVKNSYSQSIALPNTANNAKLFGNIYRFDRIQTDLIYNPSKRVDFKLFNNGDLFESGYAQLNNISGVGADRTYNITLYGGLGDFFYNLKYKEDGTELRLYDLNFGLDTENPEREFDTVLNAEFVNKCFNKDWNTAANDITDIITFIPAYNGLYDNFSSNTALINLNGQNVFPTQVIVDGETYSGYNGYGLAKLDKSYTEWELKEFRATRQRPAIKVSKLIETICNNSGYTVEYDNKFFNTNNPYWNQSFLTLPTLSPEETEEEYSTATGTSNSVTGWVGYKESGSQYIDTKNISITSPLIDEKQITTEGNLIDLSQYPITSKVEATVDFSLIFNRLSGDDSNTAYLSAKTLKRVGQYPEQKIYLSSILVQARAYNEEGTLIAYSDIYNFTNSVTKESYSGSGRPSRGITYISNPTLWGDSYVNDTPNANIVDCLGYFKKGSDGKFVFVKDKSDTFKLSIPSIPYNTKIRIELAVKKVQANFESDADLDILFSELTMSGTSYADYSIKGYTDVTTVAKDSLTVDYDLIITSGTTITKKIILSGDTTPADVLLSYSKLFGLYFVKDTASKKITILSRNSFFKEGVVDLTDKIDRSKDLTIDPILFDKKWYQLNLNTPSTYFASKYEHTYKQTYGQQRIDTGYNFNSDKISVYDNSLFKNTLPVQNSSQYYRNFYTASKESAPAFLNNQITYTLYKDLNTTTDSSLDASKLSKGDTTAWNTEQPGVDIIPKQCFYSGENSKQDIDYSLVLYNGLQSIPYTAYITDDTPEQATLNNNELCYLWTNSEYDINNKRIAYAITKYPVYTSIQYNADKEIFTSLDFGVPQELYLGNDFTYLDSATIYSRYWQNFYKDQYNVNTKKCTCYVRLDNIDLRSIYSFENSYWILNKVDGFDITSYNTTRCEFIKIQSLDSYLNGVVDFTDLLTITGSTYYPSSAGNYYLYVYSPVTWELKSDNATPTKGNGYTTLTIQLSENTTDTDKIYNLQFLLADDTIKNTSVKQAASGTPATLWPDGLYYEYTGGTQPLYLSCGGNWSISTDQSWVKSDFLTGYGSQTLNITTDLNAGEARTAKVTVTSADKDYYIYVTQYGRGN